MVSVNLSVMSRQGDECLTLVEGGVCDGWLAWFALRAARERTSNFEYWAYDSWEGMRAKDLLPSELGYAGNYEYLDLEQTRRNLSEFGNAIRYCKGYVPESLNEYDGPPRVHWLHIDLNAAKPTEDILAHFWDRIPRGGVVLLDDYTIQVTRIRSAWQIFSWRTGVSGLLHCLPDKAL